MSKNNDETIITLLMELGLSSYQAKAYHAGLKGGTMNASDYSRLSGVPRAKIYSVLEDLVNLGLLKTIPAKPYPLYVPVDPILAINKFKEEFITKIETLQDLLDKIKTRVEDDETTGINSIVYQNMDVLLDEILGTKYLAILGGDDGAREEIASKLRQKGISWEKEINVPDLRNIVYLVKKTHVIVFQKSMNDGWRSIKIEGLNILSIAENLAFSKNALMAKIWEHVPGYNPKGEEILQVQDVKWFSGAFNSTEKGVVFVTSERLVFGSKNRTLVKPLSTLQSVEVMGKEYTLWLMRTDGQIETISFEIFIDDYLFGNLLKWISRKNT